MSPDIAKAKDGSPIRDNRNRVGFQGILIGKVPVPGNCPAGFRYTGSICKGKIVLVPERHLGPDLEFSMVRLVQGKCLLVDFAASR